MVGGELRWIGDIREGKDDDAMVLMMNKHVVMVMTIRIGKNSDRNKSSRFAACAGE